MNAINVPPLRLPDDQSASGRSFGDEELALLAEVIGSGTLTSTKGVHVKALEQAFAARVGAAHAVACASGSAAVHVAVAAVDPAPGDEIVTTSITDMGALTPIVYQGAIPTFADVDPRTGNVTADTIAAVLSPRTKAIIVTHLFGVPCEMDAIMALAAEHGLPVIEDSAQAFDARSAGRHVGTIGTIGCFSLQQGKHITTGEGGLVVTDDEALARRMRVFVNKAWPYGEPNPDHEFLALNYRLTELQGAVARAQLAKLDGFMSRRRAAFDVFAAALAGLDGVQLVQPRDGDDAAWWRLPLLIDEAIVPGGPVAVAAALREVEIPSAPRYIQKPAFACAVFRDQRTFGDSRWPFTLARPEAVDYDLTRFEGTTSFLRDVLVLPWNEKVTDELAARLAAEVRRAVQGLVAPSTEPAAATATGNGAAR
ncbi:MAG: DegT/DnrJ/EryC1/StrS family aminotransferase [Acidimicrobiia bacterium]